MTHPFREIQHDLTKCLLLQYCCMFCFLFHSYIIVSLGHFKRNGFHNAARNIKYKFQCENTIVCLVMAGQLKSDMSLASVFQTVHGQRK